MSDMRPDFDQMALDIATRAGRGDILPHILEGLRRAWNARGVADIQQLERPTAEIHNAIRSLDVARPPSEPIQIGRDAVAYSTQPYAGSEWDARGEADKDAVATALRTLMGGSAAQPYLTHIERAIDALAKP